MHNVGKHAPQPVIIEREDGGTTTPEDLKHGGMTKEHLGGDHIPYRCLSTRMCLTLHKQYAACCSEGSRMRPLVSPRLLVLPHCSSHMLIGVSSSPFFSHGSRRCSQPQLQLDPLAAVHEAAWLSVHGTIATCRDTSKIFAQAGCTP